MIKSKSLIIFQLVLFAFLLFWRYRLGLTRYFDIDEFAHLHWGYNFFSGLKPYSDFLYFFPPLYLLVLYPLFLFVGKSSALLIAARQEQFISFLLLLGVLFLLVREITCLRRQGGIRVALLSIIILSFLPLPYDKFLEVRPDTLATIFALTGVYFLIRGIREIGEIGPPSPRPNYVLGEQAGLRRAREMGVWFLAGLFYSLGVVTLPKVVFFLAAAFVVLVILVYKLLRSPKLLRKLKQNVVILGVGFGLPLIATALFFIYSADFTKALYLTTTFSSSSSKVLGSKFYMFPSHFFHPNDTYYAEPGVSLPLILNLSIYLIAIIWGIVRFVSFLDKKTLQESLVELLVTLSFLINLIVFIKFIPLKHAQYFIVFAPFIALYFADFINVVLRMRPIHPKGVKDNYPWGAKIRELMSYSIQLIVIILILWKGYSMYKIKSNWTNQKTLDQLVVIYKTIPFDEYLLDLYGQTIFYKDPYYVCCIPYGQYLEAFAFKLPSLTKALEKTKTKYIFVENEGRLSVLPPVDAKFIRENYKPSDFSPTVWVFKESW